MVKYVSTRKTGSWSQFTLLRFSTLFVIRSWLQGNMLRPWHLLPSSRTYGKNFDVYMDLQYFVNLFLKTIWRPAVDWSRDSFNGPFLGLKHIYSGVFLFAFADKIHGHHGSTSPGGPRGGGNSCAAERLQLEICCAKFARSCWDFSWPGRIGRHFSKARHSATWSLEGLRSNAGLIL